MAIMARWRMPPENSWGYCLARSSALGMFTSFRYLMASSAFASWMRELPVVADGLHNLLAHLLGGV